MPLGNAVEFMLDLTILWSPFKGQAAGCRSLVQLPFLPFLAWPRQFQELEYCPGNFHPAFLFAWRCSCLCLPRHKTRDVLKILKRSFVQSSCFQKRHDWASDRNTIIFLVQWFSNLVVSESHEGILEGGSWAAPLNQKCGVPEKVHFETVPIVLTLCWKPHIENESPLPKRGNDWRKTAFSIDSPSLYYFNQLI